MYTDTERKKRGSLKTKTKKKKLEIDKKKKVNHLTFFFREI